MTITVDQKGSVALPDEILRQSDLHPGDQLEVTADGGAIILRKAGETTGESLLDILHDLKGLPIPERRRTSVRNQPL